MKHRIWLFRRLIKSTISRDFPAFYNVLLLLPTIILVAYIIYWLFWYKCLVQPQGELMLVTPVVVTPQSAPSAPPTNPYSSQGVSQEPGTAENESSGIHGRIEKSTSSMDSKTKSRELAEQGAASMDSKTKSRELAEQGAASL